MNLVIHMIPKVIHFIFGLDKSFGGKPFSYFHYLAVRTAAKIHQPDSINFYYEFEPQGEWWEKAKPLVNLQLVKGPTNIFGNAIQDFAHKADVLRLEILMEHGGIYMDLDVISVRPVSDLLQHTTVMAREHTSGLCNAVILAQSKSQFLEIWYDSYRTFNDREWSRHSVQMPFELYQKHPDLIRVLDTYQFFFPMHNDPSQWYLWWTSADFQNFKGKVETDDPIYLQHLKNGRDWQLEKIRKSYGLHLWEQAWYDQYLKWISPEYIISTDNNFSVLIRSLLSPSEIEGA